MENFYHIQKNENEQVRFTVRPYKGELFFDVRLFFKNGNNEYCPTKKGVTLHVSLFSEFGNALSKLAETLATEGVLKNA